MALSENIEVKDVTRLSRSTIYDLVAVSVFNNRDRWENVLFYKIRDVCVLSADAYGLFL